MIARFVVTIASLCCCIVRFCAGDADDVAMNEQIKQCAAAIKNDLQTAIASDGKKCPAILKICELADYSTAGVRLERLSCGRASNGIFHLGADLKAKLRCPGEHAEAVSKELMQRLCLAPKLSPNTEQKEGAQYKMMRTDTPSGEFVEGLIATANSDETAPNVAKLATFLGHAATGASNNCKKYVISCEANPGADELKTRIVGDGCVKKGSRLSNRSQDRRYWSDYAVAIMSSIDLLHCGDDKSVVGKKSFEKYAAALDKVAATIQSSQ